MRVHHSVSAIQAGDILAACALSESAPLDSLLNTLATPWQFPPASDSLEEERLELVHAIALEVLSKDGRTSKQKLQQADLLRGILSRFADCSQEDRNRGQVPFYIQ